MGRLRNAIDRLAVRHDADGNPNSLDEGVRPPARSGSTALSLERAVGLVPVYRSIFILATIGGQLRLGVSRGGREIETPGLAASPDVNLTASRFFRRTIVSLASTGRAYWRKYRHADGSVASYVVLNPLTTSGPRYDQPTKRWVYDTTETTRDGRTRNISLPARDVRHLKLLEIPGVTDGVGPIQAARIALSGAIDVRDYAANWFRDSGVPNGVLTTDMPMTPELSNQYRDGFKASVEGHDIAVVGHGLKYESMFLKPEDAQWLAAQQFTVTDVARLFGIPANYLLAAVEGSSMTYSNLEQVDTQFLRTTLMAYLNEIEDAISADLPRGQVAEFKTDRLLRGDVLTRASRDAIYLDRDVISPAYVAEREGFPTPPPPRQKEPALDA